MKKYALKESKPQFLRRYTWKLYPTKRQESRLLDLKGLHQRLYNGALEERIEAYKRAQKSISFVDQCKSLTDVRHSIPEYGSMSCAAQQATLKKLDKAFAAFFKRAKSGKGKSAGFPRFKSFSRFSGWEYRQNISGWKIHGQSENSGKIRLEIQELKKEALGDVKCRGPKGIKGVAKSMTIQHKDGKWFASIVFDVPADVIARESGVDEIGFDWGIESFITLSTGEQVRNPRIRANSEKNIRAAQKAVSRSKRNSKSRRRKVKVLGKVRARIAAQRKDFHHKTANVLVARSRVIATEKLNVKGMTGSAKGTAEKPGKNVQQKAGLNRSILDGAPGAFLQIVEYKAAEAGVRFEQVATQKVKPSQTCPQCGNQEKKQLSKRWHSCPCGAEMHRDHAAALVCIKTVLGREPEHRAGGSQLVSVEVPMVPLKRKPYAARAGPGQQLRLFR